MISDLCEANELLIKSIKHKACYKPFLCLWLYLLATAVNAQTSEPPLSEQPLSDMPSSASEAAVDTSVQAVEPDAGQVSEEQLDTDVETGPERDEAPSDKQEYEEQYRIYKREHPDDPCDRSMDTYDYEESWYDSSQVYINSRFCEPALWFDNFFANDRIFEEGVAGTYIRWRNEFTFDEEEDFKFKTAISASVELPGTEKRLRLTFDGDEDEDLRDIAPGNGEETTNSLGLQLDLAENDRSKFNVSVSLSPRIRFRYRYTYPVLDTVTLRYTQEIQRKKQINSALSRIDIEKLFGREFLFRSTTEGRISEEFDGVDWLQAFVLYQRINKKTSISYESSANGITEPLTQVINYRLGLRFRKNFHREWLFYEIAPEVTWPITYDEARLNIDIDRRSKWLLFFRLEVHFGNAYKKRYKDYN